MSERLRSRGLAMAGYQAKEVRGDVNRQLKTALNRSFAGVAIQPVADIAPPAPVMQNVGLTLMLGMGEALAAGIGGMPDNSGANDWMSKNPSISQQTTVSAGKSMGYGADTYYTGIPSGNALPSGSFGISSIKPRGSMINYFTNN